MIISKIDSVSILGLHIEVGLLFGIILFVL